MAFEVRMQRAFLNFSFCALIALLWAVFITCTVLSYHPLFRGGGNPFITTSPLTWTAIWSFIVALSFVTAGQLTSPRRSYRRLWINVGLVSVLFGVTGGVVEDYVVVHGHKPEFGEGLIIFVGCIVLGGIGGVCGSSFIGLLPDRSVPNP